MLAFIYDQSFYVSLFISMLLYNMILIYFNERWVPQVVHVSYKDFRARKRKLAIIILIIVLLMLAFIIGDFFVKGPYTPLKLTVLMVVGAGTSYFILRLISYLTSPREQKTPAK